MFAAPATRARSDICSRNRCETNCRRPGCTCRCDRVYPERGFARTIPRCSIRLSRSGRFIREPRPKSGSGNSDGKSWKTPRADIAAWCPRRIPSRLSNSDVIRELVNAWRAGDCLRRRRNSRDRRNGGIADGCRGSHRQGSRFGAARMRNWVSTLFAISTDTDFVYLDYKKPTQRPLRHVTAQNWRSTTKAGHFPPGNMGPKIESVLRFLQRRGKEAVITSCEHLCGRCERVGRARTLLRTEQR